MKIFQVKYTFILFSILAFSACKKTSNEPDTTPQGFSFEYNGKTYYKTVTNNIADCSLNFNNVHDAIGFTIDKPDVFGGKIIFPSPDCAYLVPSSNWEMGQGCTINAYGQSFDSSAIYFYKSGNFTSTRSNCVTKTGTDPITGQIYQYTLCDFTGSFSLTLQNNKGDIIEIKNGSFKETYQFD